MVNPSFCWLLKKNDIVEVNGEKYTVTKTFLLEKPSSIASEYEYDLKIIYLDNDHAIEISELNKEKFYRVERPAENEEKFVNLELRSLRKL